MSNISKIIPIHNVRYQVVPGENCVEHNNDNQTQIEFSTMKSQQRNIIFDKQFVPEYSTIC